MKVVFWRHRLAFVFSLAFYLSFTSFGLPLEDPFQPLKPSEYEIGSQIADISFIDIEGKTGKLSDYQNHKALVVILNTIDCPLCGKFAPALLRLQKRFEERQVAFLMVNVNKYDSIEKLRKGIQKFGFTARYIPDLDQALSAAFRPLTTTEYFILDKRRTLIYRGPLSDQYGLSFSRSAPRHPFLEEALETHLAGGMISVPARSAPGCVADVPTSHNAVPNTYHSRISRIIQRHCENCHRDGGPSFSLSGIDEVKAHAKTIKYMVSKGLMPPWFADPKIGSFRNDNSLSDRDRAVLLQWIDGGMELGNGAEAPLPMPFGKRSLAAEADAVFTIPEAIRVSKEGLIPYQFVRSVNHLKTDRWVRSMQLQWDHPEVTHHIVIYLIDKAAKTGSVPLRKLVKAASPLAVFFIGQSQVEFPEGVAAKLPKNKDLLFQIHYNANGVEVRDRPKLLFQYAQKAPKQEAFSTMAFNTDFVIPPRASHYAVTAKHHFKKHSKILGLMPHMHLRGKAFRYELHYPNHQTETILDVPRFDFNWQIRYQPNVPIDIPAGTELRVTAWYDNSEQNPNNPAPDKEVRYGEQLWEEMMFGFFDGYTL